ncbi:MAG: HAD-IB family phosphatase, partial [Salinisphaeraceae bacterium]|nr:HAD-IB family phosphatase [Salinisphaeraceae bacterium]
HRSKGDELLIITATNRFVTEPIATELGIPNLLATDPEVIDGQYTGEVAGTPCFQAGKVQRLKLWLDAQNRAFGQQYFYSDSHNDLPLLEKVDIPVAVDADEALSQTAQLRGWREISLRKGALPNDLAT